MGYRMIDDVTLSNFRRFMASGIPLKEFAPQGAFDSRPRRARDQGEEGKSKGLGKSYIDVLFELKDRVSPEGFRALCEAVADYGEGEAEDDEPLPKASEVEPETAQDRRIAMDYHARFPHAQRGVVYAPELAKPVRPLSGVEAQRYAIMFPDAAKIGRA